MSRYLPCLLTFAHLTLTAAAADLMLADHGLARAVIVASGHEAQAKALAGYLKQITGAEFALAPQPVEGQAAIVLALVDQVPGASDRASGKQAYRLTTAEQRLTLTAASELGLSYAVYGLLEDHLGCRFYTYKAKGLSYGGPGYEVVPTQTTLAVAPLDELQEPAFAQRGFIFWPGSYPWIVQNRGAGYPADTISGALAAGHDFYEFLPPQDKKDAKGNVTAAGLFAAHPEFYPLGHDGKRAPDYSMGLCGTNADLPEFLAKALIARIEFLQKQQGAKYNPALPIPVAQGDGFTGCQCANCRQLVHAEQSEAAPQILLLNRALDLVAKTYPAQQFNTFAYFESLDAPKTLKPHANLWINVVSSAKSQNMAGDQVGPIRGNPANRDYARALAEWPKLAPGRVTTWHWVPFQPEWPAIFYLSDIMKYWQQCGIYGTNPQLCGDNWMWLYGWVYLKLAWNPQQDADTLIRQFLADNYGAAAAPHVYQYLKLAQAAYADSGLVPSAVRWSGWTQTTRVKMFPPAILAPMTAAMDAALAAAQKEATPAQLANLIEARGNSLDALTLNEVAYSGQPWGPATNARDGKHWFVAGADARVPACLERSKQATAMNGGGEHGVLRTLSWFVANNGGPLVDLTGPAMRAAVCPDLKGEITSAVDLASGKELLAVQGADSGYRDLFDKVSSQIWLPVDQVRDLGKRGNDDWSRVWSDFQNPTPDALETDLTLSPPFWGFDVSRHLRRTVSATTDGLQVVRSYTGKLDAPSRFTTRWRLALPTPALAKIAIKGGGVAKVLDLQYAVAGGIKGMKAGDRLPGLDAMDQRFDEVLAVSDAEPVKLPLAADATGDLVIQLDRGDGVAAVLTTPVAGWDAVEIKPVVDGKYVELKLVGTAAAKDATTITLPLQTLSAKAVPVVPLAAPAAPVAAALPVVAKLKATGPTTAINELDGMELVWIPAGKFLRGSPEGQGAGDERPQQEVTLDGYWIGKTPVTVAQYQKYCEATGKKFEPTWGQGMHVPPTADDGTYAVQLNWYEADAYAKWVGAALPSEAQWEKAARGSDGRAYPWGNDWDPKKCVSMEETLYQFTPGFRPVGSTPAGASPYGVLDLAGGVWEWVADWYDYSYYRRAPAVNPPGPDKGSHKVLRGGCAFYDERSSRCAARMIMPPHVRDWTPTGFRCVINQPNPAAK